MEGDHLECPGVDGRIILKWILQKWNEGQDLAQNRDRWWGFVNTVMNLLVP
jgi:hypothetical protein